MTFNPIPQPRLQGRAAQRLRLYDSSAFYTVLFPFQKREEDVREVGEEGPTISEGFLLRSSDFIFSHTILSHYMYSVYTIS